MSNVRGLDALSRRLSLIVKTAGRDVEKGLRDCAWHLQSQAAPLAPHDLGDLEGDIRKDQAIEHDSRGPFVRVGSGLPYALVQHEDLSFQHSPGKQAKYLEEPFMANASRYRDMIARIVGGSRR